MVMALCLGKNLFFPKPQFERARVRSPPSSTSLLHTYVLIFENLLHGVFWILSMGGSGWERWGSWVDRRARSG